jgi:hypothetical protein
MVDPIVPISGTSASRATQVDSSLSVAEPQNAWVAARQSHITADLLALQSAVLNEAEVSPFPHHHRDEQEVESDDRHPHKRHDRSPETELEAAAEAEDSATLSGESDRIGTGTFDPDTPFGERSAIL